jgi:hypothetical protein
MDNFQEVDALAAGQSEFVVETLQGLRNLRQIVL